MNDSTEFRGSGTRQEFRSVTRFRDSLDNFRLDSKFKFEDGRVAGPITSRRMLVVRQAGRPVGELADPILRSPDT